MARCAGKPSLSQKKRVPKVGDLRQRFFHEEWSVRRCYCHKPSLFKKRNGSRVSETQKAPPHFFTAAGLRSLRGSQFVGGGKGGCLVAQKRRGGKRGGGGYVHSLLERTGVKGVSLSLLLRWRRRSLSSLLGRRVSPDSVAPPREKKRRRERQVSCSWVVGAPSWLTPTAPLFSLPLGGAIQFVYKGQ